jgi:hypothetical protein
MIDDLNELIAKVRKMSKTQPCYVGTHQLVEELCQHAERQACVIKWQPIDTVPREGYVELRGPSGYIGVPYRVQVGYWGGPGRWITHSGDNFTDDGESPTHWRPLS